MKKLFAIISSLLIALVLVGCGAKTEAPQTKAPVQTTAKPTNVVTTTLSQEDKEAATEKNKKELAQALDQALMSSNGTKLSSEFTFEAQVDANAQNLISESSKAKAAELGEKESFDENIKLHVNFTFKFEIDTEALTAALQTKFYISDFEANMAKEDNSMAMIKSLFFNEDGSHKEFTLYVYYADKVINLGLNAPVKEGIQTILMAIVGIFGGDPQNAIASANEILPFDDNHFVFDVAEYLTAEENPENDENIEALNEAKAKFASQLDYVLGKIKGQSVASAYTAIKALATQFGLVNAEGEIDFETVMSLISAMSDSESEEEEIDTPEEGVLVPSEDGEEEIDDTPEKGEEETEDEESHELTDDEIMAMVLDYINANVFLSKDGDDYTFEVEEFDALTETFNDEAHTPIISLFDIDDNFTEIKAALKANVNFTNVQFDGVSVEISFTAKNDSENKVKVEIEPEEEGAESESVDLVYDLKGTFTGSIKFALNVSTTLTLKLEELVPTFPEGSEEHILQLLENPGVREDVDKFMLENFGPEADTPEFVIPEIEG